MKVFLTILLFCISVSIFSQTHTYYWDAVNGDDTRTSAQAQVSTTAWKTLTKLNAFFTSLVPGDVVRFRSGQIFPGFIIANKAGNAAQNIRFATWGAGAKPIISGFTDLTTWTNLGGNIWETTNAVSTLSATNIVTVNGVNTAMGRTPNSGSFFAISAHTGHTSATIGALTGTPNYVGAELVARMGAAWIFARNLITNQATTVLTTVPNYPNPFGFTIYDYSNGQAFIQNSASTLDLQNEWYYNPSTKKLRIFSATSPTGVKIATTDSLVKITAGFLTFDSLQFQAANTDCFQLIGATNITVQNCDIRYIGDNGVQQQNNSPNLTVVNNTFRDVQNSGTTNVGYSGNTKSIISNNSFVNINMIPGAWGSLDGTNLVIGLMTSSSGDSIRLNTIDSCSYSGIFAVGNNYTIRNNFVNHFCMFNTDGGGIYTSHNAGVGRNIIGNIVINGGTSLANAIYGDDNASGMQIINNSVATSNLGIYLHNGHDATIRGNTSFQCGNASLSMAHDNGADLIRNVAIRKNIFVITGNVNLGNCSYQTPENSQTNFGTSDSNNISKPVGTDDNAWFTGFNNGTIFNHFTLAGWQAATSNDLHSTRSPLQVTLANTRFVYNASSNVSVQALGANYLQILAPPNTTTQWNGSITLQPWTSAVLLLNGTGPPPLTATSTVALNPVACFGNVTSVTINAIGGISPYQYRIGTGTFGAQNVFTGLGAGTYTFQVRDNALTVFSLTVTINQPTQITITQSSTPITINGQSSTTTVTANGGTPGTTGYRYSLDGGINQPSNVFTGVLAGPHTITVTDGNGCTNTLAYTLTQPSALVISAVATPNPLLCANGTGTITVTASGATPPYQYSINGGAFQSPNTFTGLVAGTYTITVKDAAGALKTTTVIIAAPTALTLSEGHTAILINGNNSTVTFTAGGGTAPYTYSINGGTSYQSSNVFSVPAGTYNGVVKDANGCTTPLTFTISQPSSLSGSAVVGTILCFNGSAPITVTPTGGTPPYQYSTDAVTFQSSNVFTKTAGTYNITIKDAAGALFTFSKALTQPTQITITESHTAILINGNTSDLTLSASGATAPYTYSIDGVTFQSSPLFNNLVAGTYTATVKDANNCTNTLTLTITQPSSLALTVSATSIPCSGGGSTATATANGGTGPYQYKVGTGAFQPTGTFTNLPAGTYLFTVQDGAGAITTTNKTITQPAPIVTSLTFNDAPTSVVVGITSGGVGPFLYRLDGSAPQSSNTFLNVPAGNHTSLVTDANGCVGQQAFTINNPVFIGVSFPPILCNGGNTPVTITASGGVPPYTIAGGSPQTKTAGNYTFTVTDSRGSIGQFTTTIPQPAPMTISESHTPILINGNTSNITFTVIGGTSPYTYSLDGVTFQSSNVFNNKPAGNYTVTVKDANNCINIFSFTITQPGALSVIATPGTIACPGGTTTVTLTANGGTGPYHYRINNQSLQLSNIFLLVPAGTNTFTVQDNFGAVAQVITTISEPTALTVGVVPGTILVNGGSTNVVATGNGGTAPYQYSIDGGTYQGSGTFTGVLAGPHTITVKDANNCTNFNTFTITQPGALGLSVSLGTITCNGGPASASTITGSGGTLPYTYSVDGGAYGGSNSFTGLLAGAHTFSIKDAFGSIAQSIQNISQPTAIILTVTPGTIIVNGGVTNVVANAVGGGGGIQYSLDGGAYQVSGTFTGVSAGPHTVTAKDVSNCTKVNSFSISQPGALHATVTFGQNPLLCYGITTPMTITPTGGTAPYTITGGSPQIVSSGTYTVHVTDAFNVPFDTIVTLTQPALTILVQVIQYPSIVVYGGTADSVWVSSAGGVPISGSFYNYALDGGSFTLSDSAFKYKFTNVTGGNHTVTIRDSHGCAETYPFFVQQGQPPVQKQTHSWDRRRVYKNQ